MPVVLVQGSHSEYQALGQPLLVGSCSFNLWSPRLQTVIGLRGSPEFVCNSYGMITQKVKMCMHSSWKNSFFVKAKGKSVFIENRRRTSQNASLDPWVSRPQCEKSLWVTLLHSRLRSYCYTSFTTTGVIVCTGSLQEFSSPCGLLGQPPSVEHASQILYPRVIPSTA